MRKKFFNMMEDMKGKIRVYARVRPMLSFEKDRGQKVALNIPDELTLDHIWKEKKREYQFDAVFEPIASQEKVSVSTKHRDSASTGCMGPCIYFRFMTRMPICILLKTFACVCEWLHPLQSATIQGQCHIDGTLHQISTINAESTRVHGLLSMAGLIVYM